MFIENKIIKTYIDAHLKVEIYESDSSNIINIKFYEDSITIHDFSKRFYDVLNLMVTKGIGDLSYTACYRWSQENVAINIEANRLMFIQVNDCKVEFKSKDFRVNILLSVLEKLI
jgi:hypothetical protein